MYDELEIMCADDVEGQPGYRGEQGQGQAKSGGGGRTAYPSPGRTAYPSPGLAGVLARPARQH